MKKGQKRRLCDLCLGEGGRAEWSASGRPSRRVCAECKGTGFAPRQRRTRTADTRRKHARAKASPPPKVPNKGSKGKGTRWFYDFETVKWDTPLCCVAISEKGDVQTWTGSESAAAVAEFQAREGGEWWAHAGGVFDHLLVARHRLPAELVLAGSSVLRARGLAVRGRPGLLYRDSYPRWLASLAKVGKAVGLEKLDAPRHEMERMSQTELLRYCQRDVEILKLGTEIEDAWLAQWDVRASTSGTAAVKLLEALDPRTWDALSDPDCMVDPLVAHGEDPSDLEDASPAFDGARPGALEGVRGGRVETRVVGRVDGPIYVYDLHSSYPSQYAKGPMPIGCVPTASTDLHERVHGWLDLVTWRARQGPGRTAFELGGDNDGAGMLTAWCTSEMAHALEERGCKPQRHGVGFAAVAAVDGFAREFSRRLFAEKEGGGPHAFFAKVTLNSLHGKFAENQQRFRHVLRAEFRPDGVPRPGGSFLDHYQAEPVLIPLAPYHQPLTGAFVLSRARLTLALAIEAVERGGFRFFYCDTDSLHTDCPPEILARLLPGQVGSALGQWGHEFTADAAIYLGPKLYALKDAKKIKSASKGFPRNMGADPDAPTEVQNAAVWRAFELALSAPQEIASEGLAKIRQGASVGTAARLVRALAPTYIGRIRLPDGRLEYSRD